MHKADWLCRKAGITFSELLSNKSLSRQIHGPSSHIDMSFSYFSKICGRFADAELVIKKPHGGREKRYILTEKGKLLREHLIELIKILKEGKDV